jgi:glutamate dehydrogenase
MRFRIPRASMSTPTSIQIPGAPATGAPLDELCRLVAERYPADADTLTGFVRHFLSKAPRPLLEERTTEELLALTTSAFRFLEASRPERVDVQVLDPADDEVPWSAPVTVLRAAVSDRPFVVDTLREYLSSEGLTIQHFVHPVLRVERTPDGGILRVAAPTEPPLEALVHCEIQRVGDPSRREALRDEIVRRLDDVVAATTDFPRMAGEVARTQELAREYAERFPDRSEEFREIVEFLAWLRQANFVLLGYRAYEIIGEAEERALRVRPGSGLGILRREALSAYADPVPLTEMSEEMRRRVTGGPVLIISKSNALATVHRRARMDYIGIKTLDEEGRVTGERRFLGLFTSKSYAEHADTIPILRRKLERILADSGAPPGSHDYKEIITIFNSMPKEELFQSSAVELEKDVQTVLAQLFGNEVRVVLRPDPLGRGVSVMVILPRGKFSVEARLRIQESLTRRLKGEVLNYHLALGANDQARLHFYVSVPEAQEGAIDSRELELEVGFLLRSWEDHLAEAIARSYEPEEARRLTSLYLSAFPEEYRASTPPVMALEDIRQLERLWAGESDMAVHLRQPTADEPERVRGATLLNLYLRGERLVLSDFMPTLEHAGVRVIEVNPYGGTSPDLPTFTIYSFVVQGPDGSPLPLERADHLAELLLAVRAGDAQDDIFNALVLQAGFRWREADVLRTYVNYAFQIGVVPARLSAARTLLRYPESTRLIFELYRQRFDPRHEAGPDTRAACRAALNESLEQVGSLTDDRILRRLCTLIEATVRTNYFRHGGADPTFSSGGAPYVSIKVRSADVEELRRTRLLYEIYVHSAHMEGVHLRGAAVSRGGIRWSDRPDDFRTEVMGLVQTQIVKNAVIVPGGSKGGFITKRSLPDRDAMMREAADQYRTLIRGMLDVTDNLVDGEVVPPPDVVRYDGDDPYLVVAADKGTAHLSDAANAIAEEYGFWLGDAFASGGSFGYDHKREGITARGAWECVKRHFREMGKDIQAEPFTVVGIGDMSGDVFGNGMLLSRQIRLLAAFDHRHIFLDPDPDPATSYAERERVFGLPRSSWEDYDRSLLSAGGMIVPRASKEITLSQEVRAALGLTADTAKLDGEGLVRAVLRAPAELLWNGGIGTYVKDPEETHAEAGDSANDPVRIDADELRCQVIGEGGNLGLTQRGRIAFALRGGRLNTDALDNSGGVDMSDHEVNLKILLNSAVTQREISYEQRNELLEAMTDDVASLVLRNNFSQSLAVSLDQVRSRDALQDFAALITSFEREKLLERGTEGIPSSDTIAERAMLGIGLTRPTLCVLLAYAKLHAQSNLLASELPDDAAAGSYLLGYFPATAIRAVGTERLQRHRLRREIVTTELVNDLVNLMGASFLHRTARDTGRSIPDVARAWLIASLLAGASSLRADLAELEGRLPAEAIYRWYFGLARVLEGTTHWVLANVAPQSAAQEVASEHLNGLSRLRRDFGSVVTGVDAERFQALREEIRHLGADQMLAERIVTLRFLPQLLDILRIAQESSADPVETARVYYLVSERFGCSALRQALRAAAGEERWEKRHAQTLAEDVDRAHRTLARSVLLCRSAGEPEVACVARLEETRRREIESYRELGTELAAADSPPLAGWALAARSLSAVAGL